MRVNRFQALNMLELQMLLNLIGTDETRESQGIPKWWLNV